MPDDLPSWSTLNSFAIKTINTKPRAQYMDIHSQHSKIQSLYKGRENKLRIIDEWAMIETIGMSGYSKVKLGLHKKTGQKAALKIIFADNSGKVSQSRKKQLIRELKVMKKIDHPNIMKLITFNADAKYPEAVCYFSVSLMSMKITAS